MLYIEEDYSSYESILFKQDPIGIEGDFGRVPSLTTDQVLAKFEINERRIIIDFDFVIAKID